MQPRITVITLGVDDLERALAFYRDGLGLPTEGIVGREFEHGAVAFFDLQSGVRLALWARDDIAHDVAMAKSGRSATDFTLSHNVGRREEVDAVMIQAERAGARMVTPAHDTFWGGYAGYFSDPDDHLWEVVWNPQWVVDDSGVAHLVRRCFDSYATSDRTTMESLLAADFTFTSQYDDHIDRAAYFERCWPGAGTLEYHHLERVVVDGDACFVLYDARAKTGERFRNAEIFRRRGDQIVSIEVFFGRPAPER